MDRYWSLREEFYRALHRWPVLVASFVVGGLVGWLVAFVWPAYSKAVQEVYVGLNPYRAYSDVNFLALAKPKYANLDNYTYWQMHQLETVIYLDAVLQETLESLRQQDAYWGSVDVTQLRAMLDADWRTAGLWRLIAAHPEPGRAEQVVTAWSQVAVKDVEEAVNAARQTFMIDQQLQATTTELAEARLRQQQIPLVKEELDAWQAAAQDLPAGQPLDAAERWRLFSMTGSLVQFTPSWMALAAEQPAEAALPADYIAWVGRVLAQVEAEQGILAQRLVTLEAEHAQLQDAYDVAADGSLGLSPNLEMQGFGEIQMQTVRPTMTLVLIGGISGLLIWVLSQLVIIGRRQASSQEENR